MNIYRLPFAASAALFIGAIHAGAADYDPPIMMNEAQEVVPVEIGSGWYLRGDIGYNIDRPFDDGAFVDLPDSSFSRDEFPVFGSVGMGYHWSDFLRTEVNVGYLADMEERASQRTFNADGSVFSSEYGRTDNQVFYGTASALVDLGTFVGFTPYLGAGIGGVYTNRRFDVGTDIGDNNSVDFAQGYRDRDFSLGYVLNAGVSYAATKNMSIDLGYQYFNAPDAEYTRLTGPSSAEVAKGLDIHQVKVGLRYDLW